MTTPAHLKIAVGVVEAADLLDLSEASVRRLIAAGHLARVPHTDRVLIARAELDRFAQQSMQGASA